jgi:ABC-type transport system involved in multi-copper enzyme maturation permease subunit
MTPYRPGAAAGHDSFAYLLRAEWMKLRTIRGWIITIFIAAALPTGFALLNMGQCTVSTGTNAGTGTSACPAPPTGPGGEAVTDQFSFGHRALAGNGSITVRVTSLTGLYSGSGSVSGASASGGGLAPNPTAGWTPGIQPWSKAGIIITASTKPGSPYAAMMVTGSHGVRMQWNYTGDTAGLAGNVTAASPRWLRLVRHGGTITGYDSADGTSWTKVGTVTVTGLPATALAGLFATSPAHDIVTSQSAIGSSGTGVSTQDTGTFDHLSLGGTWPGGTWTGDDVGDTNGPSGLDRFRRAGAGFTVSGSGDIAPVVPGAIGGGTRIEDVISVGSFAAVIAVGVLGALFITAEYRRGLIRLTLAASPRRGRVLAAKAIVIGAVTLAAGIAGIAIALPVGLAKLRGGGNQILPVTAPTELRVIAGAAALIAAAAVLALAVGAVLRRGALAVTVVIAGIVLPYLLAITALPAGAADWVLRITPAAAIAAEQSVPAYPQVTAAYTPMYGYYPLQPWAGFAVLCAWTVAALALAAFLLHRRDA